MSDPTVPPLPGEGPAPTDASVTPEQADDAAMDDVVIETVVETVVVIEAVDDDGEVAEVIGVAVAESVTVEEVVPESSVPRGELTGRAPAPALTSAPVPTPLSAARPTPGRLRPPASAPAVPATPPKRVTDPRRFGRIDDDGTVWLSRPEGDVVVGNWAAGTPEEGLAFFGRKYDDVLVEVDLAAHRLREGRGSVEQARAAVDHARAALAEPAFLGDVLQLAAACDEVEALLVAAQAKREEARRQQRAEALAKREAIVAEAESLAGSRQWKATGERYAALLEEWKAAPRIDRGREQTLWKRFSTARTAFDKARRQHFAALESERKEAIAAKESVIAQARTLSASTDWAETTRAFRTLMDRWKAAGHAGRQDEDRLWAEFRGLQETFFAARSAANAERDTEFQGNLERKEALLVEAEALDPKADLAGAKRALRSIQERWEDIGHVPRGDKDRVEGRLRAVEDRIRAMDQERWRASNPEARARAEDTSSKFRASLEKAEQKLAAAQASGDARAIAEAERTVESTKALLAAAEGALQDFSR